MEESKKNRAERRREDRDMEAKVTLREAIEIASSVSNDVINNYHNESNPIIISLSLQVELLKSIVIKEGLITDEHYEELFEESVDLFNKERREKLNYSQDDPDAPSVVVEDPPNESDR